LTPVFATTSFHRAISFLICSPKRCAGGTSKQQRVTGVACNPHPAFVRFSCYRTWATKLKTIF
jgi:hypothetical protein